MESRRLEEGNKKQKFKVAKVSIDWRPRLSYLSTYRTPNELHMRGACGVLWWSRRCYDCTIHDAVVPRKCGKPHLMAWHRLVLVERPTIRFGTVSGVMLSILGGTPLGM